jgi:hypothetical protein
MHHYAHTIESYSRRLPYALKGSDAIFYSVVRHLGHSIEIRPVLSLASLFEDDQEELANVDLVGRKLPPLKVTQECAYDYNHSTQEVSGFYILLFARKTPKERKKKRKKTNGRKVIELTWRHDRMEGINWLNRPSIEQLALVHLAVSIPPSYFKLSCATKRRQQSDEAIRCI